ncbi:hypothetical protein [Bacillus cereus]|uniref:hypothetical protein n=1 Tax=Bacillus cereus TaxID=1396 RepID=UPI000BED8DD0|nr:hypothetical protein [Bacillus cereus]PDY82767.1 hypothetical protein CON06_10205 [Bacillus cereus]
MSDNKKKKSASDEPRPRAFKEREMINPTTGAYEKVRDLHRDAIGIFVKSEEEKKKERDREFFKYRARKLQFIQFNRTMSEICGQLKQSEFHSFMKVIPYVGYKDQLIMVPTKKKEDGETVTTTATATLLYAFWGVGKSTGFRYLSRFIELGLFEEVPGKGRTKHYKATGKLFFKGKNGTDEFTVKVFQRKLKEIIENVDIEIQKFKNRKRSKKEIELYPLSILGALIPYFHFETFCAVKNFDEKVEIPEGQNLVHVLKENPNVMKHLKKTEVWRLATGLDSKPGAHQLKIFDTNLEILFRAGAVLTKRGKKTIFLIHPDLLFVSPEIRDKDYYDYVLSDFTQTS